MTFDELALAARENLHIFPKLALDFLIPRHLWFICRIVQQAVKEQNDPKRRQEKKRIFIFGGPPRHGKTKSLPVCGSAWILGNYPKKEIIIAAYNSSLAEKHSKEARALFQKWGPVLWGQAPSKHTFSQNYWCTSKGGGVRAVGTDAGAGGYGADIMFIDDYHKDSLSSESKTQRENVWDWWQSAAVARLHPGGCVFIFATRWHDDDLCGKLIKQAKEEEENAPFEVIKIDLPAIAGENDVLGRKPGEALWPWWANEKTLGYIKTAVGPYMWSALYQANPTIRSGNLWKEEDFRYFTIETLTQNYLCWREGHTDPLVVKKQDIRKRMVLCDPALETKEINDPTGMHAWAYVPKYKIWLLLDRIVERIEHTKILTRLLQFAYINKCTSIGMENEKLGKVVVKQSAGEDEIHGKKIPFIEIPTGGVDKFARATVMANYNQNERVFMPRNAPWLAECQGSLKAFPSAEHDEDVDCASMAASMESKTSVSEALAMMGNIAQKRVVTIQR